MRQNMHDFYHACFVRREKRASKQAPLYSITWIWMKHFNFGHSPSLMSEQISWTDLEESWCTYSRYFLMLQFYDSSCTAKTRIMSGIRCSRGANRKLILNTERNYIPSLSTLLPIGRRIKCVKFYIIKTGIQLVKH